MTTTLPSGPPRAVPHHAADHVHHWRRLEEERRFRIGQLADLEADEPPSARHESVMRVLRTSAAVALSEIEAALARMEQGRYGLCVSCDRRIDPERLEVLPMTPRCMSCHYNEQNCRRAALSRQGFA